MTSAMNKIERVRATLAGRPVDRAPFTVWYHFGNQHAPAERTAQVHLEFFDHYDLDLLKLMNDYDYPMPAGMEVVATAQDLGRLQPFDPTRTRSDPDRLNSAENSRLASGIVRDVVSA